MDDNRKLLEEEIKRELERIGLMSPDDVGYEGATDRLDKLYRLWIEEKKVDEDISNARITRAEEKKGRWIKFTLDGLAIALPLAVSWVWMGRSLRFEETGSFTSRARQWVGTNLKLGNRY